MENCDFFDRYAINNNLDFDDLMNDFDYLNKISAKYLRFC